MNDKLIVIIYVDDILIYGRKGRESQIDDLIDELKREEVALHKEGTAEGYLGVDIKRDRFSYLQSNHKPTYLPTYTYILGFPPTYISTWDSRQTYISTCPFILSYGAVGLF